MSSDLRQDEPWRPTWAVGLAVVAAIASIAMVIWGLAVTFMPGPYRAFAFAMGLPLLLPSAVAAPLFVAFARNGGKAKLAVACILLFLAFAQATYLA